jgi:hypothetical protein
MKELSSDKKRRSGDRGAVRRGGVVCGFTQYGFGETYKGCEPLERDDGWRDDGAEVEKVVHFAQVAAVATMLQLRDEGLYCFGSPFMGMVDEKGVRQVEKKGAKKQYGRQSPHRGLFLGLRCGYSIENSFVLRAYGEKIYTINVRL